MYSHVIVAWLLLPHSGQYSTLLLEQRLAVDYYYRVSPMHLHHLLYRSNTEEDSLVQAIKTPAENINFAKELERKATTKVLSNTL